VHGINRRVTLYADTRPHNSATYSDLMHCQEDIRHLGTANLYAGGFEKPKK